MRTWVSLIDGRMSAVFQRSIISLLHCMRLLSRPIIAVTYSMEKLRTLVDTELLKSENLPEDSILIILTMSSPASGLVSTVKRSLRGSWRRVTSLSQGGSVQRV